MASKRRPKFKVDGEEYRVGSSTIPRISWQQLYRTLVILKDCLKSEDRKVKLDAFLGSTKPIMETNLWGLLVMASNDPHASNDKVKTCLWIISCYGYMNNLPVTTESGTWPHPSPPKKLRNRTVQREWDDELKCPVCFKPYSPPKNYKHKEAIINHFKNWVSDHLENDPH